MHIWIASVVAKHGVVIHVETCIQIFLQLIFSTNANPEHANCVLDFFEIVEKLTHTDTKRPHRLNSRHGYKSIAPEIISSIGVHFSGGVGVV